MTPPAGETAAKIVVIHRRIRPLFERRAEAVSPYLVEALLALPAAGVEAVADRLAGADGRTTGPALRRLCRRHIGECQAGLPEDASAALPAGSDR